LPAHKFLSDRHTRCSTYCVLGAGVGAGPFALAALIVVGTSIGRGRIDRDSAFWLVWAGIGAVYGVLSAVTFWVIAVRAGATHLAIGGDRSVQDESGRT